MNVSMPFFAEGVDPTANSSSSKTDTDGPRHSTNGSSSKTDADQPPRQSADGSSTKARADDSSKTDADEGRNQSADASSSETESSSHEEFKLGSDCAVSPTTAEINGEFTDLSSCQLEPF